jgi:hypothetical protein
LSGRSVSLDPDVRIARWISARSLVPDISSQRLVF